MDTQLSIFSLGDELNKLSNHFPISVKYTKGWQNFRFYACDDTQCYKVRRNGFITVMPSCWFVIKLNFATSCFGLNFFFFFPTKPNHFTSHYINRHIHNLSTNQTTDRLVRPEPKPPTYLILTAIYLILNVISV